MTVNARKVLAKALTLPPVERAELVEQILSSFEFPSRTDIDALWANEAVARIDDYDQKKIKATRARKVFDPGLRLGALPALAVKRRRIRP